MKIIVILGIERAWMIPEAKKSSPKFKLFYHI